MQEQYLKEVLNFKYRQPYQQAMYSLSCLLEHKKWQIEEYAQVLPSIQAHHLEAFFPHLLSRVWVEGFVIGNLGEDQAVGFFRQLEAMLAETPGVSARPLFPSQHGERRTVALTAGRDVYHPKAGLNPEDDNSAILFHLQVAPPPKPQKPNTQNPKTLWTSPLTLDPLLLLWLSRMYCEGACRSVRRSRG